MSFFNATANVRHATSLPADTTLSAVLESLHNHDLLIRLDPEFAHYESQPLLEDTPNTKRYKVTDHMHTLPRGLWDTTVSFDNLITDLEDGALLIVKGPLGLTMKTTWRLVRSSDLAKGKEKATEDAEVESSEWTLVMEGEIKASRFLVGTAKSKCEENWPGMLERFVGHLKDDKLPA